MRGNSLSFTINYLVLAIKTNSDRAKMGFMFNQNMRKKVSSRGFCLGLFDIISDLVIPLINKDSLWSKIDFSLSFGITSFIMGEKPDWFGSHSIKNDITLSDSTSSQLFFLFMCGMNVLLTPICKETHHLSRQVEHFEKQLKSISENDPRRNNFELAFKRLKAEFILHRLVFEDSRRIQNINLIYQKYLFSLPLNINEKNNTLSLPSSHLLNYGELQTFLTHINSKPLESFGEEHFKIFINFLSITLKSEYKSSQPIVQAKLMDVLFSLHISEKRGLVSKLEEILGTGEKLSLFLGSFIEFYAAVEHFSNESSIGDSKHRYRHYITKFLNEALHFQSYSTAFQKALEVGIERKGDFIGFLFADLNYFLEEVFLLLEKLSIKKEEVDISQQLERMSLNRELENNEEQETPESLESTVKSLFSFGRETLEFIGVLSLLASDLFEDSEWAEKVATALNYYATRLSSSSFRKLSKAAIHAGIQPLDFIQKLVSVYLRVAKGKLVKRALINDERSFSTNVLEDLGNTCQKMNLFNQEDLLSFKNLISELDMIHQEKIMLDKIIGEPPDEFSCPLTMELMTDPVRLPASEQIVSRKAIKQHFALNGFNDPFTKTKLSADELESDTELKKRVEIFLEEKKKEFKHKLLYNKTK